MITLKELRQRARNSLDNKIFSETWLFALLACAIVALAYVVLETSSALALVSLFICGCFDFGLCTYFLHNARGQKNKSDLKPILCGFSEDIGRNIIAGLLVSIFTALWTLLLIVPGIIKYYAYSMTFYIMRDNPGISAYDAIKESEKMMKGYKMKAFLLDLSFIGWLIVGALCLGVGTLWVAPYMLSAKTELYEYIRLNPINTEDTTTANA